MSQPLAPRDGLPADSRLPLALVGAVWGGIGIVWLLWAAGRLAARTTGAAPSEGWSGRAFDMSFIRHLTIALADGGPPAVWPELPQVLTWAAVLAVVALLIGLGLLARVAWPLLRGDLRRSAGLATRHELTPLLPAATLTRARSLRPSLAGFSDRRIPADAAGSALGVLRTASRRAHRQGSAVVRASWEDVKLAIMAPRAGKTTSLAVPEVLSAPGAVLATSNKADLWTATAALRASDTGEEVWTFDPQNVAATAQTWWWNPLAGVHNVEEASRLAGHFIQEIRSEKGNRDFWSSAAHDLLAGLLLAAAVSGRDLRAVYEWLNDPVIPTPSMLLRKHGFSGAAASLVGRQNGAPETRDGVYETARTAAQCLRDDNILSWVTPPTLDAGGIGEFDSRAFPTSRQTLYLLSKEGAGAAAPLVAALADRVMRDGVHAAERRGGRLDPPMCAVLDEAANVCRISDLPDLYSHLGSRGIVPLTILQSYRQGVRVWGEAGMDTLWSAATIKLLGAGMDDPKLAEDISRLIGDHDVTIRSYSDAQGRRSTSTSLRRQRILAADHVRALPKGTAILLATGIRAAHLTLLPWYSGPRSTDISAAIAKADAATIARRTTHDPVTA